MNQFAEELKLARSELKSWKMASDPEGERTRVIGYTSYAYPARMYFACSLTKFLDYSLILLMVLILLILLPQIWICRVLIGAGSRDQVMHSRCL